MGQLGLDAACDGDVPLFVRGQHIFRVVGDGGVARRNVGLRTAKKSGKHLAAALRTAIVHFGLRRSTRRYGAVVCSGLTNTSILFSYITLRTIIRSTDCISR